MATIHPINKNAGIIAELEIATGKMAVVTKGGAVVLLKIPKFRKQKGRPSVPMITVKMPESIACIGLDKFAEANGCRIKYDRETGGAQLIPIIKEAK